jgi:AcrR family transcriptional regulator
MKKNDEIRETIIKNTKELMRTKPNITIKDIAESSYVNIAAVNYYFGDKDTLISIVVNQVIVELKETVNIAMNKIEPTDSAEKVLTIMIDIIYQFALNNTGIISYIFLNSSTKGDLANLVLKEFLSYNDFTKVILTRLSETTGEINEKNLYARYMLIFSSFCIPLFIEIMKVVSEDKLQITSLLDEELRSFYIQELLRIIK